MTSGIISNSYNNKLRIHCSSKRNIVSLKLFARHEWSITLLMLISELQNVFCFIKSYSSGRRLVFRTSSQQRFCVETQQQQQQWIPKSYVAEITTHSLAGATTTGDENGAAGISFVWNNSNFVAITGETGSGKSLLLRTAADLILGGKLTPFILTARNQEEDNNTPTTVQLEAHLGPLHLNHVNRLLEPLGLQPVAVSKDYESRLQDATVASTALNRPSSRLAVLDFGIPSDVKATFRNSKRHYRSCQKKRLQIQQDISRRQRVLPVSYSDEDTGHNLMHSWIQEFQSFQQQMDELRRRASTVRNSNTNEVHENTSKHTALHVAFHNLAESQWRDYDVDQNPNKSTDDFYSCLLHVLSELKNLDIQFEKSRQAYELLYAMSSSNSAISALEKARNILMDMESSKEEDDPITIAVEHTHSLLNEIEFALRKCAKSIDNDEGSICSHLEFIRRTIPVPLEEIEHFVRMWNSLARKHGVSPYKLIACQKALMEEYQGSIETKHTLLPAALAEEESAKRIFESSYHTLREARHTQALWLSGEVTKWLPQLGMEGCQFQIKLHEDQDNHNSLSTKVDFILSRGGKSSSRQTTDAEAKSSSMGGFIASSGEKARLMLILETVLPGSIGSCCNYRQSISDDATMQATGSGSNDDSEPFNVPPVAVIYDEIDAHVGGRAVVAVAKMMCSQSRSGGQVISITHSASVAALADRHLSIERQHQENNNSNKMTIKITNVTGEGRKKELARMTGGNMATEEAEVFAEALMRERERHIYINPSLD